MPHLERVQLFIAVLRPPGSAVIRYTGLERSLTKILSIGKTRRGWIWEFGDKFELGIDFGVDIASILSIKSPKKECGGGQIHKAQ